MRGRLRSAIGASALGLSLGLALGGAAGAHAQTQLGATTVEPRAYGYQVGDVLARNITVRVPEGLVLDESSVPQPGARGKALELRRVDRQIRRVREGGQIDMTLEYQVFLAPTQVRTLEMPVVTLRFIGPPRNQDLRIDAWPVTVAPLVPVDVSPRQGLGELQPDAPPPLIDTSAARLRLLAYLGVAMLLLAWLAHVYLALPWWSRRHRPFTTAWRALRSALPGEVAAQRRQAFLRIHEALNQTAGETVFEHGLDRFLHAHPRFEPLRPDLTTFFAQSRQEFFAPGDAGGADADWLLAFCRRCRDAERGSA
ncbi:hypothetical protein [Ideonella sp. A 288]|uniref:hypothetical protein n=1 Tax=Ideonella sp. A 288 TaxID=1962181 RepID=UPI001302FEF0|nr:hypothetical protein [Ideonella sp. A 288]